MKDYGILFTGESVRGVMREDDPKTQTRRLADFGDSKPWGADAEVKEHSAQPGTWIAYTPDGRQYNAHVKCRYPVGSHPWVKETWRKDVSHDPDDTRYRADIPTDLPDDLRRDIDGAYPWRPSIFMPRQRSRITLEVLSVRVERLQDISEADARAEGIRSAEDYVLQSIGASVVMDLHVPRVRLRSRRDLYAVAWDTINTKRAPWASNPWIWRIEFRRMAP